ncbi:DedA family protein [Actinomadura nitritigenes]|uniref:DedA family protein n=1 Tax=Actinomadura nitritigenes TaxID=134602 RepID=UPI0036B6327E
MGFFLPGDSLLFTAGLLCTAHAGDKVHLPLVLVAAAGAVGGAQTGFWPGRRGGRALLARTTNRHLLEEAARARRFLARYGHGRAIVLARFVPVVRTVLNPLAGALDVPAGTFALWQVTGGLLWAVGVAVAGYLLGSSISGVDRYLLPIGEVIVVVSLAPVALEVRRGRRAGVSSGPRDRDGAVDR